MTTTIKRLLLAAGLLAIGLGPVAARAALFTTWTSATTASATGIINDPGGPIGVDLGSSVAAGFPFANIQNSADFGTFNGSLSVDDVYEPDPPGTADFLAFAASTDAATYTLTFSRAVTDPVFHVSNLDFRDYSFLGGLTPTVLSGLNLEATGSVVGDTDPATFDGGENANSNKGNPNGSAYGSFVLSGTYTQIEWTRPLVGSFGQDGNRFAVSLLAPAAAPEPPSLVSFATAGLLGLFHVRRRRRRKSGG
jgi:hypothetical protein